jgi:hypothetical protein
MQFDPDALMQREAKFRDRLNRDPGDCDVRLDLTWCMLLRALYHAGRAEGPEAEALVGRVIKEALNISVISGEARHAVDVARIEFICKLLNDPLAIGQGYDAMNGRLRRLAADIADTDVKRGAATSAKKRKTFNH